jgi:uncharacterized protein YfiM (DUF2279 family)
MTDFQDSSPSPARPKGWGYRHMPGVGMAADYNDTEPSAPSPLGEPGQLRPLPPFWRRILPLSQTARDWLWPTLVALVVLVVLLLLAPAAHASCTAKDSWHGPDKVEHLALGALVSGFVGAATQDPRQGVYWGVGAAIGKEALDSTGLGTCSAQDAIWTLAGVGLGYAGTMFMIGRDRGTTSVRVSWVLQ